MVVDDAIVVLENITKHIDRGSRPREAAKYGTNEVWLSVIVTTLVTVAVFFPLTLVTGMTGILFKQLGWIVLYHRMYLNGNRYFVNTDAFISVDENSG